MFTAVAWMYTPDIESRVNVCPTAGAVSAQRSARAPSGAVAKRLEVILRSSTSSTVPISTTLPSKWRRKKSLSSFSTQARRSASEKVGMSSAPPAKLSVIVSATAPAVATFADAGAPVARAASSAAIEGTGSPSTMNSSGMRRITPSGSSYSVQRPNVASESDRGALAGRGQDRIVLMLDLAEHDLAGARAERKRTQIVPVEAAQAGAQGFIAERHLRLLDRGREYDVETHDLGAAVDDRGQHPADLGRPGDARTAFERRGPEGFLIERDHDRGRGRRQVHVAEGAPAQHGQQVDREAPQPVECGRGGEETGARVRSGPPAAAARRRTGSMDAPAAGRCYWKRSRRLTTGAGPDLALASIWNGHLVAADARIIDRAAGKT